MSAVSRIDKGYGGMISRYHRRSLLGMSHGDNVRIVGDGLNGIRYTFAFGCRGTAGSGKAQNRAA